MSQGPWEKRIGEGLGIVIAIVVGGNVASKVYHWWTADEPTAEQQSPMGNSGFGLDPATAHANAIQDALKLALDSASSCETGWKRIQAANAAWSVTADRTSEELKRAYEDAGCYASSPATCTISDEEANAIAAPILAEHNRRFKDYMSGAKHQFAATARVCGEAEAASKQVTDLLESDGGYARLYGTARTCEQRYAALSYVVNIPASGDLGTFMKRQTELKEQYIDGKPDCSVGLKEQMAKIGLGASHA